MGQTPDDVERQPATEEEMSMDGLGAVDWSKSFLYIKTKRL
jgi:hypothetical protein